MESEVLQRTPTEMSQKITLKRVNTVLVSDTENEDSKVNAIVEFLFLLRHGCLRVNLNVKTLKRWIGKTR